MMSSTVAASRTEAVDEVVMAAIAVKLRIEKAVRELDEAINELVSARDKEGESHEK